jgi:hypothetical protein
MIKTDLLYTKLLGKPFLKLMLVSLWPLLTYLIPSTWIIIQIVPYLYLLVFLQLYLLIVFILRLVDYFNYSKFDSYEEAYLFFQDLKRVKRAEKISRRIAIKNEQKLLKERKIEAEKIKQIKLNQSKKAEIDRLKQDLEDRKKKVL